MKWIVLGFLLIHLLLEFLCLSIDSEPEAIEQGHYQEQYRLELLRRNAAERKPKTWLKHTFPSSRFARWAREQVATISSNGAARGFLVVMGPLP